MVETQGILTLTLQNPTEDDFLGLLPTQSDVVYEYFQPQPSDKNLLSFFKQLLGFFKHYYSPPHLTVSMRLLADFVLNVEQNARNLGLNDLLGNLEAFVREKSCTAVENVVNDLIETYTQQRVMTNTFKLYAPDCQLENLLNAR